MELININMPVRFQRSYKALKNNKLYLIASSEYLMVSTECLSAICKKQYFNTSVRVGFRNAMEKSVSRTFL